MGGAAGAAGPDPRRLAAARPRVRVNQLGHRPDGPKRATVVTAAPAPLPFAVRTEGGRIVHTGLTEPWPGPDPSSGLAVHTADFTALTGPYERLRLTADGATSHPFRIAADVYSGLAADALRFFHLQRSGVPISEATAPGYGRPAGHVGVPPNRGDTAVRGWSGPDAARLYPGWRLDRPLDVSGGWYDAGDHGKYVVNGGLSAALLLSAAERAPAGPLAAALREEARWEVEWLLRMQVPAGERHAGLAFHRVHGDHWTPLPLAPHRDPSRRVLHRPSTAAALNLAAVAAQAARLLPADRDRYLAAATTAYEAARREPDLLAPPDGGAFGGGPYDDATVADEFYWAAAELLLTTGEPRYGADVEASPCARGDVFDPDGFDWDEVAAPARMQLARAGAADPAAVLAAADRLVALQRSQPWGQPYAPAGGWDWGSTGRILANLVVLATAHDLAGLPRHRAAALAGLDFVLGRNAHGLSFVTGHGTETAHRQRVRHFGHALDPAFPPPPPGSLAGGPASKHYPGFPGDPRFAGLPPQFCYLDEPTSETTNDVCIRWNAALVWMAAYAS